MNQIAISTRSFVLSSVVIRSGIDRYCRLMSLFNGGEGCGDKTFRRLYTGFYRVRRPASWIESYFALMSDFSRRGENDFGAILKAVDAIPGGGVEISFSSKMLATIDPKMPIWDSQVKAALGLADIPAHGSKDCREARAIGLYGELRAAFARLLAEADVKREIAAFDSLLPDYAKALTDEKKLDYLLWSAGRPTTTG